MVFSSILFIFYFLPLTLLLYYAGPSRLRNLVLLVMSLAFYSWGEPVYVSIMLFSTIFDYGNGLAIEKCLSSGRKRLPGLCCFSQWPATWGFWDFLNTAIFY